MLRTPPPFVAGNQGAGRLMSSRLPVRLGRLSRSSPSVTSTASAVGGPARRGSSVRQLLGADDGRITPAALHTAANCGRVDAGGGVTADLPTLIVGEGRVRASRAPTDRFRTSEAVDAATQPGLRSMGGSSTFRRLVLRIRLRQRRVDATTRSRHHLGPSSSRPRRRVATWIEARGWSSTRGLDVARLGLLRADRGEVRRAWLINR